MKIGLAGSFIHKTSPQGLVTGFNVATESLARNMLCYSRAEAFACLYTPKSEQEGFLKELQKSTAGRSPVVQCISEYDALFHPERLADVDLLHSVKENALPLLSLREALPSRVPIAFTMHCLSDQHLMNEVLFPLSFMPFQPYDAVICTSRAVQETIGRMLDRFDEAWKGRFSGRQRVQLRHIPLGVDTDAFRPMDQLACRAQLGIPADAFVILWFGRFSELYKADLFPLLHVFEQLLRSNPDARLRLMLVGCEGKESNGTARLRERIQAMNLQEHTDIRLSYEIADRAALYSAADVFTSPVDNIQETFGLTPIEAMACGTPQVVSDWDGYRDTVAHSQTGFLIPTAWCDCMQDVSRLPLFPENYIERRDHHRLLSTKSTVVDSGEYLRALQWILDHPRERALMGAASRQRACDLFDIRHTVAATDQLWQELIEQAQRQRIQQPAFPLRLTDYCADFRGYPSRWLDDSAVLTITAFGMQPGHELVYRTPGAGGLREAKLLPDILRMFREQKTCSILQVIKAFPDEAPEQVRRCVMLLYKYDGIGLADV